MTVPPVAAGKAIDDILGRSDPPIGGKRLGGPPHGAVFFGASPTSSRKTIRVLDADGHPSIAMARVLHAAIFSESAREYLRGMKRSDFPDGAFGDILTAVLGNRDPVLDELDAERWVNAIECAGVYLESEQDFLAIVKSLGADIDAIRLSELDDEMEKLGTKIERSEREYVRLGALRREVFARGRWGGGGGENRGAVP